MAAKRFRTRRQKANANAWTIIALVVAGTGVVLAAIRDSQGWLYAALAIGIIGYVISVLRDRSAEILYVVENDRLLLRKSVEQEEVEIADVIDASLLERVASRDFIKEHLNNLKESGISDAKREEVLETYLRYCSIDIGMRSMTLGIGRGMIDTMRSTRHDLVLLRIRDGRLLLLSPSYEQDMVDSIGRSMQRIRVQRNRA